MLTATDGSSLTPGDPTRIASRSDVFSRFLTRRRLLAYSRLALLVFSLAWLWWVVAGDGLRDRSGKPIGGDFVTFWSAATLVADGEPAAVYELDAMHEAEKRAIGGDTAKVAWLYPPSFLALVSGLSLLPYLPALGVWLSATLGALLLALRRHLADPLVFSLSLAFPGVMQNAVQGQTGFLSGALLASGLLWLDRRPALAGAALGLMTYKPHLAPLVFIALLAGRRWEAFAGAVTSAIALAALSLVAFGWGTWAAFFENISFAGNLLYDGLLPWHKLTTISGAALLAGLPIELVYLLQAFMTLAVAGVVGWLWWSWAAPALRNSALCLGVLLATPYAFDYDLVIMGLALLWLGLECSATGWRSWERELLAVAWVSPVLAPLIARLYVSLEPLLLVALLAMIVRRAVQPPMTMQVPSASLERNVA
ncbi:MAG TPA: glycosyltransferase family 87 protein [Dehalococcoidia bacterium]|nr:glycosyltransferase family 87 protein [Dehalococcoidia bacterium]